MFIFVVLNTRALAPFVPMLRAPKKLYRATLSIRSGAPAARRAAKRSPITIGTESHACIEIETQATLFSR